MGLHDQDVGRGRERHKWHRASEPGANKQSTAATNKLDSKEAKATAAAEVLLNPPATFSQCSQDLAVKLAERARNVRYLGQAMVWGVFISLATSTPAETAATRGWDLGDTMQALMALDAIRRNRMRTDIALELTSGGCIPNSERGWWEILYEAL